MLNFSMIRQEHSELKAEVLGEAGMGTNGSVHRVVKRLTHLRALDLRNCTEITDAGVAHLKGLTQLQSLALWGAQRSQTPALHT